MNQALATKVQKIRQLPVTLTPKERDQRAARLAERIGAKKVVIKARTDAVQLAYRELKEINAEIDSLADVVASGREMREVEVIETRDLDRRVLEVVRVDTHEVVDSRQLAVEEMQTDLPFVRAEGERSTSHSSRKGPVALVPDPGPGDEPPPADEDAPPPLDEAPSADQEDAERSAAGLAGPPGSGRKKRRKANVPDPQ